MSRLEETVNDADIIFEAVIDDLKVKQDLLERKSISWCCGDREGSSFFTKLTLPIKSNSYFLLRIFFKVFL